MKGILRRLFGSPPAKPSSGRPRLAASAAPAALYAIGDVHGHLDLLRDLEQQIFADARAVPGEKWIIMLGDYIDRGPQSSAVLDHLLRPVPAGWKRICLCGNHEHAMAQAMGDHKAFLWWLEFGGVETLMSYGISKGDIERGRSKSAARDRLVEAFIPQEHVAFLERLPVLLEVPGYVFVHAGLRPGIPLEEQSDQDLLWFREHGSDDSPFHGVVVHGHTPVAWPELSDKKINVDTGAYATGILSAVFLGEEPRILQARTMPAASPVPNTMRQAPRR